MPAATAIPRCITVCSPEKENSVLIGRYTGMDTIKCVITFAAAGPNNFWNIGSSPLTQNTGTKNPTTDSINVRKEFLHAEEYPSVIPVKRKTPKTARTARKSRNPSTLPGQYPKKDAKLKNLDEAPSPCVP